MTPATEPAMQNTIIYDTDHFCLMCKVCDDIYESETIEFSPTNYEPRCPECHTVVDHTTTLDFCNCLNDFRYMIHEDFREWASANPSPENLYIIIGSNMGWQRRNGYTIIDGDDDLIDNISVNSDFTQHWTFPARDAHNHYPAGSTITCKSGVEAPGFKPGEETPYTFF